jgi:hypothetical protein
MVTCPIDTSNLPALIEDTRHTENFLDRQRFLQFQLRQRLMQDLQQMLLQVDALFAIRQNEVLEEVD